LANEAPKTPVRFANFVFEIKRFAFLLLYLAKTHDPLSATEFLKMQSEIIIPTESLTKLIYP
jgi:hypothetical protein